MESEFIQFIASVIPGEIYVHSDRYQIVHSNGDVSTIWLKSAGEAMPSLLEGLTFFDEFDGADLFSSTFKIASNSRSRLLNGIEITPTFAELQAIVNSDPLLNRSKMAPFMSEAGIWIYMFDSESSMIRKWNIEDHEECDSYSSLHEVIQEWVDVIFGS